ncbi:MAG TPA: hypothetical protein PLR99_13365, partial [Polyangiaceae bacterium]|nr:hypothetical protein [Polyangiaceae bacterium]
MGSYSDGSIAELLVYDQVLSSNERALLVAYFTGRHCPARPEGRGSESPEKGPTRSPPGGGLPLR